MALEAAMESCNKSKSKKGDALQGFGDILCASVGKTFKNLEKSNSEMNDENLSSAPAGALSRKQMASNKLQHKLQQSFPDPTERFANGETTRLLLHNYDQDSSGKRFRQNNLT